VPKPASAPAWLKGTHVWKANVSKVGIERLWAALLTNLQEAQMGPE
jgi:hypothetical protein